MYVPPLFRNKIIQDSVPVFSKKRREAVRYPFFLPEKFPAVFSWCPRNGMIPTSLHLFSGRWEKLPKVGGGKPASSQQPKKTRVVSCFFCWLHLRGPPFPCCKGDISHPRYTLNIHRFRWIPRESNRFFLRRVPNVKGILATPQKK